MRVTGAERPVRKTFAGEEGAPVVGGLDSGK